MFNAKYCMLERLMASFFGKHPEVNGYLNDTAGLCGGIREGDPINVILLTGDYHETQRKRVQKYEAQPVRSIFYK